MAIWQVDGTAALSTSEPWHESRDEAGTHILKELRELDERLLDARELGSAGLNLAEGASGRLTAIAGGLQTRLESVFVA